MIRQDALTEPSCELCRAGSMRHRTLVVVHQSWTRASQWTVFVTSLHLLVDLPVEERHHSLHLRHTDVEDRVGKDL